MKRGVAHITFLQYPGFHGRMDSYEHGRIGIDGLKRLRGRLAVACQCGSESIDALTLGEFADTWQTLIIGTESERETIETDANVPTLTRGSRTSESKPKAMKSSTMKGVSLRSAAETLASRGEGSVDEILNAFRKHTHKFTPEGFSTKKKNQPLYSVATMAKIIVKCGYADTDSDATKNLNTKLEDCRDS